VSNEFAFENSFQYIPLMLFNVDNFKVMYIGLNNIEAKYEMNGKFIEEMTEKHNLNVFIWNDIKCSSPCIKAVILKI